MIYLILNEAENMCKIGYSENPAARLATLQTGCPYPLKIVSTCDGGLIEEKKLHSRFKDYKIQGEWFQYVPSIKTHFKVTSNQHVNVFIEDIGALAKCSGAEKGVVLCSLQYLDYDTNEFILTPERRAAICVCGNIRPDTVSSAISRLLKKNIIIKKSGSTYILNPKIFFYGKDLARASVVEATMVYEIGGGKKKPSPLSKNRTFKLNDKMQPA
jgi:hypothetical protein